MFTRDDLLNINCSSKDKTYLSSKCCPENDVHTLFSTTIGNRSMDDHLKLIYITQVNDSSVIYKNLIISGHMLSKHLSLLYIKESARSN